MSNSGTRNGSFSKGSSLGGKNDFIKVSFFKLKKIL